MAYIPGSPFPAPTPSGRPQNLLNQAGGGTYAGSYGGTPWGSPGAYTQRDYNMNPLPGSSPSSYKPPPQPVSSAPRPTTPPPTGSGGGGGGGGAGGGGDTTPNPYKELFDAILNAKGPQGPKPGDIVGSQNVQAGSALDAKARDAGSRRVGSVNYDAVGNLSQYLNMNPGAYGTLWQQGLVPEFNGQPYLPDSMWKYDQGASAYTNPLTGERVTPGAPTSRGAPGYNEYLAERDRFAELDAARKQQGRVSDFFGSGAGGPGGPIGGGGGINFGSPGGGGPPAFGAGGAAPATGLKLEGPAENAYLDLINKKGSAIDPGLEAAMRNRATGAIASGANDAIEDARIDAIRRGDTSGSTLPSVEAQIRAESARNQAYAGQDFDSEMRRENANRLLQTLGGAQGMFGTQLNNLGSLREYEIMKGALAAQNQGLANNNIGVLLGL